ncbi:hypothetical protein D3C71_1557470 [compost metagenome]
MDFGHGGVAVRGLHGRVGAATEQDHVVARVAPGVGCSELERHVQPVGDDGQARQARQRFGQQGGGAARINEQRLPRLQQLQGGAGDGALFTRAHGLAHGQRGFGLWPLGHHTPVHAPQNALRLQREDVAAHGLARHIQVLRNALRAHTRERGQQGADAEETFFLQHGGDVRRAWNLGCVGRGAACQSAAAAPATPPPP